MSGTTAAARGAEDDRGVRYAGFDLRLAAGVVDFLLEHERHAELVRLLGLPDVAVATGCRYIEAGELPDGLEESDLRRVG